MRIIKDLKRYEGVTLPYGVYFGRYEIKDKDVNLFIRYRLYISVPWPRKKRCYFRFIFDGKFGLYISRSVF